MYKSSFVYLLWKSRRKKRTETKRKETKRRETKTWETKTRRRQCSMLIYKLKVAINVPYISWKLGFTTLHRRSSCGAAAMNNDSEIKRRHASLLMVASHWMKNKEKDRSRRRIATLCYRIASLSLSYQKSQKGQTPGTRKSRRFALMRKKCTWQS